MKIQVHMLLLLMSAIVFSFTTQAQEERKVKESKVIIMTDEITEGERDVEVTVDDVDGVKMFRVVVKDENGTVQEYQWEGDEVPEEVKNELGDLEINIVEINDADGLFEVEVETKGTSDEDEIILKIKDEKGEERIIEWNGEGEIPAYLRKRLGDGSDGETERMIILEKRDERGNLHQENKVRIVKKDGSVIEWQGEGPIPEHILQEMNSIDSEEIEKVDVIKTDKSSNKAFLGIQLGLEAKVEVEDGNEVRTESVKVMGTFKGSGAEKAGLRRGDVLRRIGETRIESQEDLNSAISPLKPGDVVEVEVDRLGQPVTVKVELGTRPASASSEEKEIEKVVKITLHQDSGKEQLDVSADLPVLQLEQFEAYPNPSNEQLKVFFVGESGSLTLMISDLAGKSVYKEELENFDGQYENEIDLNRFPKGTLLLTIDQGGKRFTEKIVHQ